MKKLYAVLLGALLVLGGCGLFTPVEYTKNFKINGVVINGATGELVQGATVIWTSFSEEGGKEFTTSENGVFNIGGGEHGSYTLYVKKDGFTNNAVTVDVNGTSVLIPDMGITSYDSTVNAEIVIYPKNKSVTFNIKLADDNFGNYDVDTSIPVYAKLVEDSGEVDSNNDTIYNTVPYNPVYSGTIAADGLVTFTDLPAAPSVEFGYGSFEVGTHMYDAASLGVLDLTAADETIEDQILTPISGFLPEIVSTNLDDNVGVTDSVTVSFNKSIDDEESSFEIDDAATLYSTNETWADDMKSVTLVIDRTLAIESSYDLVYSLTSTDGYTASGSVSFSTTEGIDYVSSNIDDADFFDNFEIADNIVINFNQDIDRVEGIELVMYDGVVSTALILIENPVISGSTLTINPVGNLHYNQLYSITGTVYGAGDNATNSYTLNRDFYTVDAPAEVITTPTTPIFTINGAYDYSDTIIILEVTNVDETAEEYYAYARVVGDSDWINIGSVTNPKDDFDYTHTYTNKVITGDLSSALYADYFDVFEDDGPQTPFAAGTELEFIVLGYNQGVFSEEPDAQVKGDTETPDVLSYTTDANWTVGTTVVAGTTLTFVVNITEYIIELPSTTPVLSTHLAAQAAIDAYDIDWTTSGSPDSITIDISFDADITIANGVLDADSDYFTFDIEDTSENPETLIVGFNDLDTPEVSN